MDIGTAKPTETERKLVPHHCIGMLNPDTYFSAGAYGKMARDIVDGIFRRRRLPLVVGGSGLYIQALIDGVFQGNYRDPGIRRTIRERAEKEGWSCLHRELETIDPETARQVHENDHKRIVRALEVYYLCRKPISVVQQAETVPANFTPVMAGLSWPRKQLNHRIEQRVDQMIEQGLVEEVRKILDMGYEKSLNSLDSVGYKEIIMYLEGTLSLDEAVATIKKNTRRFAKRQMTWFRRDQRIQWFSIENENLMDELAPKVLSLV